MRNRRAQANYRYTPLAAAAFCSDLFGLASVVDDPPPTPGAAPRDPDDDKIIACALAAGAEYIVSRDRDLLSLGTYAGIKIIAPEPYARPSGWRIALQAVRGVGRTKSAVSARLGGLHPPYGGRPPPRARRSSSARWALRARSRARTSSRIGSGQR